MKILKDLEVLSIPTTTKFRGISEREVVIFQGPAGWSEFSPFVEYDDFEAKNWLKAAIEGANRNWQNLKKEKIKINATLPNVEPERAADILKKFPGISVIKIKVDSFLSDADLIEAALEYAPDAKIRLDINGGWDLKTALLNLYDFHLRFGDVFEYIEQPCQSLDELRQLKREIPMKIAVDESIRKNPQADFSNFKEFADIAILKWQPIGGTKKAIEITRDIGLPVVISSALETGIGLSHGIALASELNVELACGLGTANLLTSDIVNEDLEIKDGEIAVIARTPNWSKVEKFRANEERKTWWQARITRILESGEFDEYLH